MTFSTLLSDTIGRFQPSWVIVILTIVLVTTFFIFLIKTELFDYYNKQEKRRLKKVKRLQSISSLHLKKQFLEESRVSYINDSEKLDIIISECHRRGFNPYAWDKLRKKKAETLIRRGLMKGEKHIDSLESWKAIRLENPEPIPDFLLNQKWSKYHIGEAATKTDLAVTYVIPTGELITETRQDGSEMKYAQVENCSGGIVIQTDKEELLIGQITGSQIEATYQYFQSDPDRLVCILYLTPIQIEALAAITGRPT